MMNTADILFYLLAILSIGSGLAVILNSNPIYAALCLAATMTAVAAIFFTLEAYFLAGVQLIVYAGAVVVLFVMVLMLFDLRKETQIFSGTKMSMIIKTVAAVLSLFVLALPLLSTVKSFGPTEAKVISTENIAGTLFSKYVFAFESIGVLLLVVLVGALTLAKSKGGTHE